MAFKLIVLCAALAVAQAGLIAETHGVSYAAPITYAAPVAKTISYSSAPSVSTVYQSQPINNHEHHHHIAAPIAHYASPIAKTVSYAAPIAKVASYSSAPSVSHVYQSQPIVHHAAAPVLAKTVSYAPSHVTYSSPAIGSSAQSVIRSHDGTVSQYSKAVDTAFSSVRKSDTRVTNNVYAPVKSIAYAQPAAQVHYAHHAEPQIHYAAHATPIVTGKTLTYHAAPQVSHVTFEGIGAHYAW